VILDTGVAVDEDYFGPGGKKIQPRDPRENWKDYDFFDTGGAGPAYAPDGRIDSHAGHGTFVAGIVERLASGADIRVRSVLSSFGDGDDVTLAAAIDDIVDTDIRDVDGWNQPGIINMSLIGYTEDDRPPLALATAIQRAQDQGWVIVASAGNDATCRKAYPAAQRGVVSVGALGPTGPATFSNYGPWVRASAPGVELVSRWFVFGEEGPANDDDLRDILEAIVADERDLGADDEDNRVAVDVTTLTTADYGKAAGARKKGWVRWSGTSFSAPVVAGLLAREVLLSTGGGLDRAEQARRLDDAVFRLIDDPHLFRLPMMGTVVNAHL
jgi:subtilisin family serine protease